MLVHSTYWANWPASSYDADTCIQDHQQKLCWYIWEFELAMVSLLAFGGFYLLFSLVRKSWVLSGHPSLLVRRFINSQYSIGVCINHLHFKMFLWLKLPFYGELYIFNYTKFSLDLKLYLCFMYFYLSLNLLHG